MLNELRARDLVSPHLPAIQAACVEGLETLNRVMDVAPIGYIRAKATLLHNYVNDELDQYFPAAGVRVETDYESKTLHINNQVLVRFKKEGPKGLPSNARSGRNDAILGQLSLFPELDCVRLDVMYKPDVTWSRFEKLMLVCIVDNTYHWFIDLNANVSAIIAPEVIETEKPTIEVKLKTDGTGKEEKLG